MIITINNTSHEIDCLAQLEELHRANPGMHFQMEFLQLIRHYTDAKYMLTIFPEAYQPILNNLIFEYCNFLRH